MGRCTHSVAVLVVVRILASADLLVTVIAVGVLVLVGVIIALAHS